MGCKVGRVCGQFFSYFLKVDFFCIVFVKPDLVHVICDLVHDVKTIFHLSFSVNSIWKSFLKYQWYMEHCLLGIIFQKRISRCCKQLT